ncbi:MAG: calcium-binding protein [Quinella sp. 3Q1]|nr:calcium-binding protein [Quinella sp. 3Q1]
MTIQAGDQKTTGGKNSVKNHVDNVTILGGNESDTITNYMGRGVSINGGAGKDVIKLYSTEAFGNILQATFQPLLNAVKDFNQTKINNIIDMYNTLAEYIDGFEKISRVEATYKGKNQIELRDDLKKISEKAGELDEALDEVEDSFKAVGFDTDAISLLKKSVGKVKKIAGKGIKLTDNTEIVTGMVNEYTDNKIWSTFAKEFASDFQRNEKGRLVFPQKKTLSEPTTVRGGKGNDKIYGDEKRFYVYEYKAGDGHDTIYNWNSNDTLSITGGSYTGKIVKGDYVVTVGKGSVTFKNYTSRSIQQVLVGDSFEKLPCQIEGQMLSGGSGNDWHEASGSYWQTVEPPPEGISVDRNELTVAKNFSGEINLSKDYATYITKVDASNAAGNVEIIGSDSTEKITAGKGNDNVHSNRSFTVIHSGAGKDIVSSSGDNNSINSGADNDIIVNLGDSVTVDSGAGNDSIISDGKENLFIVADGGNKIIYGFGKTDTLQIVDDSGTYSKKKKGDDLIITADDGKITLAGAASLKSAHIEVSVTSGRDIYNDESNAVLLGTNKADTIYNSGAGVSISALGGDDSIHNYGDNVTISGGKGNDSVESWRVGTAYVYSAGNDTLDGFDEDDTIVLGSVKINSSLRADGTVTLNLSNDKTLTLTRYWSDKINTVKAVKDVKAINVVRNRDDSVSVEGSSGDDYIENNGNNVTISGGKGNDSVESWGVGTAYVYSAGNDTLEGFDEDDTIVLGSVKINSSLRADGTVTLNLSNKKTLTLQNYWSDKINTVKAVKDVKAINVVRNYDSSVSVEGSSGDDYIENSGDNVTIDAGAGDDSIDNRDYNVLFKYKSGDGNDFIDGFNDTSTLQITSGTIDKAISDGENLFLTVGKGTISLMGAAWLESWNVVNAKGNPISFDVDDGKAKNIYNDKSNIKISGSDNNDTIDNFGNKVTVTSGAGNDSIWNHGTHVLIEAGADDDTIEAYMIDKDSSSYTTLRGGAGNDHIDNHGHHALIEGGTGNDTLGNYTGDDNGIHEQYEADYSTMLGGDGDDLIDNHGDNSSIDGGKGNDTIYSYGALNIKVDGGADNDYLLNGWRPDWHVFGDKATINGGAGDDTLYSYGAKKVSLVGGAGNDLISNNEVYIWNDDNTQIIETVTPDNATINGGADDDHITNEGKSSKIVAGDGNDVISNYSGGDKSTINAGKGDDTVYNSESEVSINAGDGNDYIYNWGGGDNVTIVGGKGNDYVYDDGVGTAYVYSAGNDTLYNFDTFDTIVLGSVKVNSSVRADGNVTLKLSNKKTLTLQNYQADKVNIATSIKDVKKVNVIRTNENGVVKGTSKDDYIYNMYLDATINGAAGNDYVENLAPDSSINAGAGNDSIDNGGDNVTIAGGAGNDSIKSGGLNTTITGGKGNDHISLGAVGHLIQYASGDGKDTIIGFNETDTLTVSGGSYSTQASGSDVLVKVGKGSILLKDAKGKALNINDTKTTDIITLSDGADNLENNISGVKIKALGGNDTVYNYASSVTIDGGKGNDSSYNYAANVTIDGGAGNDTFNNQYTDNVSISGGAGNDFFGNGARTEWNSDTETWEPVETGDNVTLNGGTGNDYIYNEAGKNVIFQYNTGDGKDTIEGFNETSTLSIAGGTYTSTKSGDNVIVTVGKGKISLMGAASLSAVTIDGVKKTSKTLTVTNKSKSPVTVDATTKIIDASTRTKNIKIAGNDAANIIFGGTKNDSIRGGAGADKIYGGSGNDTLWGDAGSDSLYGGAGKDTFIYKPGEGTDKIFDYASGDMLKILKTDGKDGGTFTKGTFSKGNLTLAISGGGSVIFDGVSKGDVININGTNHTINGKTFK